MPQIIESFSEFYTRQNCERIWSKGSNRFVFANGAASTGSFDHWDPPTDPVARLFVQREFLTAKHDWAIKEFNGLKEHVLQQAALHERYSNLPGPSPEAPAALRHWQNLVLQLRQEIAALDEQMPRTVEDQRTTHQQDHRAEQLRTTQRVRHEVINTDLGDIEPYSKGQKHVSDLGRLGPNNSRFN